MHVFVSAGEPSGDLHGANLARALTARVPNLTLTGFGGPRMTAAGVDLLYPLTQLSIMWFGRSIVNLPKFFRLADRFEKHVRTHKPDVVILIDYPGFHWHLAKRASALGVRVVSFVPPQIWAWGGWRIRKMRSTFDLVYSALPFEDVWLRRRSMPTHYVGHPYFDELPNQPCDLDFVADQRRIGRPIVGLLPGSRTQEVTGNVPLMAAAARRVLAARPDVRFLVAAFNEKHAKLCTTLFADAGLAADVLVQRTPEVIRLADACLAVSGSVGLELMYHGVPSVIVYKYSRIARLVSRQLMETRFISLVNLLAGRTVYPEFLTFRDESEAMAGHLLGWLNDPAKRAATVEQLAALKAWVAVPGACARTADHLIASLSTQRRAA